MKALICDVGNTCVKVAGWPGSSAKPNLATMEPLPVVGLLDTPDEASKRPAFVEAFGDLMTDLGNLPVVVVSVVPEVTRILARYQNNITVVDHTSAFPFKHQIQDIGAVGQDRLCNVAAASAAGLSGALIVDAGTATTYDILLESVFLGGVIAPGMAFAAQALGRCAARLDPVPFAACELMAGTDTRTAMSVGAWHTGLGGVEAVISGLNGKYGELPIILTGGLGHALEKPGRYHDPDWTLRGAAVLAGIA